MEHPDFSKELINMANPVVHFEILGCDSKKSQAFYDSLFGWNIDANNPMGYGMVAPQGGVGIGGGVFGGEDGVMENAPVKGFVTFYVEVADLTASLKQAESLGGKTIMPEMQVPGGPAIAQFADPDGNVIGMMKAGSRPAIQ
jgi:hypothetical protein